jgi:hypothetical protein
MHASREQRAAAGGSVMERPRFHELSYKPVVILGAIALAGWFRIAMRWVRTVDDAHVELPHED